jgi:hypothetical protein
MKAGAEGGCLQRSSPPADSRLLSTPKDAVRAYLDAIRRDDLLALRKTLGGTADLDDARTAQTLARFAVASHRFSAAVVKRFGWESRENMREIADENFSDVTLATCLAAVEDAKVGILTVAQRFSPKLG